MRRLLFVCLLLILTPLQAANSALAVRVEVRGLDDKPEQNVLALLSVEREKGRDDLTLSRLRFLHGRAKEEIRRALQPFGYFRPTIQASLEDTEDGWLAKYQVDAGLQMLVTDIDFQVIGPGADETELREGFALAENQPLDQQAYDQAKQALLSQALELGYLNARFSEHQLRVDLDAYQASIRLHLRTGEHFRFGELRFQQDILDEDFLTRYPGFKPGDPFSQEQLLSLQGDLINSGYYSQVEVITRRDQAEGDRVPVDLDMRAAKPNRYRAGLGYSTDTGPRITLDWNRRRINRLGHKLNTALLISQPSRELKTEYVIPLERPTQDSLTFGAGIEYQDTDTYRGRVSKLNVAHSVGLEDGWRRTVGAELSHEDYEVGPQQGVFLSLVPSVTWSKFHIEGEDFNRDGYRISYQVQGAAEPLLSDSNFLQGHSSDKLLVSLGKDWRLLTRVDLGLTWASHLDDLPASKRFFAGGDNSIRGFDLDQLGPTDNQGEVVGGRFLAVGSLELERRLFGKWSAAVFTDFGNAFDPLYDASIAYSAGLGVRWRSPVGPIRVDVANGLSADDSPWRLHIVVGPLL